MTIRGDAYAIATAIYPFRPDAEGRLYDTVESVVGGHDEAKADLYARLAERLEEATTFEVAVNLVTGALTETRSIYGGFFG